MSGGLECYEVSSVDRAEVLRYLGYSGQPMTPELEARIDGEVARCLSVIPPRELRGDGQAGVGPVKEPHGAG